MSMSYKYREYRDEHVPLVMRFNERLQKGGSSWKFYEATTPTWLAKSGEGADLVWREFHLMIENEKEVRGTFCMKPQRFLINGQEAMLASWQGPISEGIVDNKYNMLGFLMMRELERRQPRLFAWGVSSSLNSLLERLRWQSIGTPILLDIVHPFQFLRHNAFLRTSRAKRLICDVLALTGAGFAGAKLVQLSWRTQARSKRSRPNYTMIEPNFGEWADDLWRQLSDTYKVIADRSSRSLNRQMPTGEWPNATIIHLLEQNSQTTVGWVAVRLRKLESDKRFGDLQVGSVIDCLALPGWESPVIERARRYLKEKGADVIVANMSHQMWISACKSCGFFVIPDRRKLFASPGLTESVGKPLKEWARETHLTLIDGDGPLNL